MGMIFAELLALLTLTGGSALAIVGLVKRSTTARMRERKMEDELRDALRSNDHQRLEDWLIIYSEHVPASTKELIEQRRNELYINSDK